MIYRLVLTLMLGGTPQEFVGTTAFPSLPACNEVLRGFATIQITASMVATCRAEYSA